MSCSPRIRHLRRTRIIRELRRDDFARIPRQISAHAAEVKFTLRHLRLEGIDLINNTVIEIDPDVMYRRNRRVVVDIVLWDDEHGGLRCREDCEREIGGLRHVVHAQVEVQHDVFLVERFAVAEEGEVHGGVVDVLVVVGVGAARLGVVVLHGVQVVGRPGGGGAEVGAVLHGEVGYAATC